MTTMHLILVICLSILVGISVIALLFFNSVFLIKRHFIKTDFKLKNKFNYYNNNTIGSNIKSIETIVQNNNKYLPILNYLKDYNQAYEAQLEIVKTQLKKLSKIINTNKLFDIAKNIKQIKRNFDKLDKQQSEYRKFNLDTQKYSDDSSNIATKLFDIISMITNFNHEALIDISYKHISKFSKIDKEINEVSTKINNEINYFNWESTHHLFLQQYKEIKEIYELSNEIYEIDKYRIALDSLCKEIEKQINNYKTSTDKRVEYFKRSNTSKDVSSKLIDNLENSKYENVKTTYKNEIIKLEKLLKEIKSDSMFCTIHNKYFEQFKDNLSSFYSIITEREIKTLYKDILNKFKSDDSVTELIHSNIDLINNISNEITNFNNMLNKNKDNIDYETSVIYMKNIYELIITFKNDNVNLFEKIKKKNKDLLEIAFIINDCSIKLMDIERLLIENNVNNTELSEQVKMNLDIVEEIKKSVDENFKGIDQLLKSKIESVKNFIDSTMDIIVYNKKVNEIIKYLKLYSNRFKNNSNKNEFKKFDKLQKEKKYNELIEEYINFIQKNKNKKKVS